MKSDDKRAVILNVGVLLKGGALGDMAGFQIAARESSFDTLFAGRRQWATRDLRAVRDMRHSPDMFFCKHWYSTVLLVSASLPR